MRLKSSRARCFQLHHMLWASRRRPSSCGGRRNDAPARVGTRTRGSICRMIADAEVHLVGRPGGADVEPADPAVDVLCRASDYHGGGPSPGPTELRELGTCASSALPPNASPGPRPGASATS